MEKVALEETIEEALASAMTYTQYRTLHAQLVKEQSTSGHLQTEQLIGFTKLNNARSKRWDKQFSPRLSWDEFKNIEETWLVITETWCGDAAQNVPVLHKIADQLPSVNMRLVFRDENTDLTDQFLTNGARSIPKLIRLDRNNEVLGTWGPRPVSAGKLLKAYKSGEMSKEEFNEAMAKFYVVDGGQEIESEIKAQLIDQLEMA